MATRTWVGGAVNIAEVFELAITGTWVVGETLTITMNSKDWVVTVGSTTTSEIADDVKNLWEGTTVSYGSTANFSATQQGEFAELTATVSGSTVTLTGDTPGKVISATGSDTSTSGSATLTNPISATGANHWSNADNWVEGVVPTDDDDVRFDRGSVDCLYGFSTKIDPATVTIKNGYTGKIGLKPINTDNPSLPYEEYRQEYLEFLDNGGSNRRIDIGSGEGTGSGRIKLDGADLTGLVTTVHSTGTQEDSAVPAVLIKGGQPTAGLVVRGGTVGLGYYDGDTAAAGSIDITGGTCWVGKDVGVTTSTTIEQSGGSLYYNSEDTDSISDFTQHAGFCEWMGGPISTLAVGGTFNDATDSAITTLSVYSTGTYDADLVHASKTVGTGKGYGSGTIRDTSRRISWTNGIELHGTGVSRDSDGTQFTLDLGRHYELTPSSI